MSYWVLLLVGVGCLALGYWWGKMGQRSPTVVVAEPTPVSEPELAPDTYRELSTQLYALMQPCPINNLTPTMTILELYDRLIDHLEEKHTFLEIPEAEAFLTAWQLDQRLYTPTVEKLLIAKLLQSTKAQKNADLTWLKNLYREGDWRRRFEIMKGLTDYWGYSGQDVVKFNKVA